MSILPNGAAQPEFSGEEEALALSAILTSCPRAFSLPYGELEHFFSLAEAIKMQKELLPFNPDQPAQAFVTLEDVMQRVMEKIPDDQKLDAFFRAAQLCDAFHQHGLVLEHQFLHDNIREIFLDDLTKPLKQDKARARSVLGALMESANPPPFIWRGGGGGVGEMDVRERQEMFFPRPDAETWLAIAAKAGLDAMSHDSLRKKLEGFISPVRKDDVQMTLPLLPPGAPQSGQG